jgi:hypothetical protein
MARMAVKEATVGVSALEKPVIRRPMRWHRKGHSMYEKASL